jgi:nucleotide-binding universal stress UspA family protein
MTLVVPFDGSALSKAALVRAVQFDTVLEEGILAVSVIPSNKVEYARERGWIDSTAPFDYEAIVSHLRAEIEEVAPEAEFHPVSVDRYAQYGTIASQIRRVAGNHDATIVFIGSENAGRIVSGVSVGQNIASDRTYDTMLITSERLPKVEKLEKIVPAEDLLS